MVSSYSAPNADAAHTVTLPLPFADLVNGFLASCAARRLSPVTIKKYGENLRRLGLNSAIQINPGDIERRMAEFGHLAPTSMATYLRSWRAFFRWLSVRYDCPEVTQPVRAPKVQRPDTDRRIFSDHDIFNLWNACRTSNDWAMLSLGLDTGARFGEIVRLRRQDVGRGYVTLNSVERDETPCDHCEVERARVQRGGKSGQRTVPISEKTQRFLDNMGDDRHIWLSTGQLDVKQSRNEYILTLKDEGLNARQIMDELVRVGFDRFSTAAIRKVMKRGTAPGAIERPLAHWGMRMRWIRLVERAGIKGEKRGPHTMRHTFSTNWLRSGGAVEILQKILGHSKLDTTMIYSHLDGDDVAAAFHKVRLSDAIIPDRRVWNPLKRVSASPNRERKKEVLAAGDGLCVRCGRPADTVDHVLPKALGGTHSRANLRPLCGECNQAKGQKIEPGAWRTVPAYSR